MRKTSTNYVCSVTQTVTFSVKLRGINRKWEFPLLPSAKKLGQGYVFTLVCDSFHRGGLPRCMQEYHPPWQGDPQKGDALARQNPLVRDPSPRQGRPPWQGDPPWQGRAPGKETPPPRHSECWEIWSTSGRYASYWNAILVKNFFLCIATHCRIKSCCISFTN